MIFNKVAPRFILSLSKLAAMLWMAILPVVASAHHSVVVYAFGELTEVEGELLSVNWVNPHIVFTMNTMNDEGQVEVWTLEAGAIYHLTRRGVMRNLFQPGDKIKVAGRPHKTVDAKLWLINMQLGDGREVLIHRGSEPRWSFDAIGWNTGDVVVDTVAQDRGMFRVWSEPVARPIYGDPLPYWEEPPPAGFEWVAKQDEFAARCEAMGMPETMGTPHPFELIDRGATIGLIINGANSLYERTFHITDQEDPAEQTPSPFGYSVGVWEDDNTLVVETTRIRLSYPPPGHAPQTEDIKFVETFTLNEDQGRLSYLMTVTDPEVLRRTAVMIEKSYLALGEPLSEPSNCPD